MTHPDDPALIWSIRRDGKECARATNHREAERIMRQLQKIYPTAILRAVYEGANISHTEAGGRAR